MIYTLPTPLTLDTLDENMIAVQGGWSEMGGESWIDNAKPIHLVTLDNFELCRYPVTQSLWSEVMGSLPENIAFENPHRPVERVSWWEAIEFCNQLSLKTNKQPCYERIGEEELTISETADGYRLPTEAEWEYAARGGQIGKTDDFPYSGSSELKEIAWRDENSYDESIPVGLKRPNALGLYDMSGNLYEWVQDWYGKEYYQACVDQEIIDNPSGPESGSDRVVRGGSWLDNYVNLFRVSYRGYNHPTGRNDDFGFRVSRYPITL